MNSPLNNSLPLQRRSTVRRALPVRPFGLGDSCVARLHDGLTRNKLRDYSTKADN
jgi:hypothetical protein